MVQKRCSKCEDYKDLETGFYFEQGGKYPKGECKECTKDRSREYHHRPDIKIKEKNKSAKFYKNNKKEVLKKSAKWAKENKEYTQLKAKMYYFRKMIRERLGREINFPRTYIQEPGKKLQLMRNQLETVRSVWNEFKVLAK